MTSEAARGRADERVLAAIERALPDQEIHYVFGGFIVLPRGTRMTCGSTLESLWGKLMAGPSPADVVVGTVLHDYELTEG